MQNSAVSFLTYSFSDSFFLRLRNFCKGHERKRAQEEMTMMAHLDGIEFLLAAIPFVG